MFQLCISRLPLAIVLAAAFCHPLSAQFAFGTGGANIVSPPRSNFNSMSITADDQALVSYNYSDVDGTNAIWLQTFDRDLNLLLEGEGRRISPEGTPAYFAASCAVSDGMVVGLLDTDQRGRKHVTFNRYDQGGEALWGGGLTWEYVNYWYREYIFPCGDGDVLVIYPDAGANPDAYRIFRIQPDGSMEEDWPDAGLLVPIDLAGFLPAGEELWLISDNTFNRVLDDGTLLFEEMREPEVENAYFDPNRFEVPTFVPLPDGKLYYAYIDTASAMHLVALIDLDGSVILTFAIFPYDEDGGDEWPYSTIGPFAYGCDPFGRLYIAVNKGRGDWETLGGMLLLDPEAEEPLVWGDDGVEFEICGYEGIPYSASIFAGDDFAILGYGFAVSDLPPMSDWTAISFSDEGEVIQIDGIPETTAIYPNGRGQYWISSGSAVNLSLYRFDRDGLINSADNLFPSIRADVLYPRYSANSSGGVKGIWIDSKHGVKVQELADDGAQINEPRGRIILNRNADDYPVNALYTATLGNSTIALLAPVLYYDYNWDMDYPTMQGARLFCFGSENELFWEAGFDGVNEEMSPGDNYGNIEAFTAGDSNQCLLTYFDWGSDSLHVAGIGQDGASWERTFSDAQDGWEIPSSFSFVEGMGWGFARVKGDSIRFGVIGYGGGDRFFAESTDTLSNHYGFTFYAAAYNDGVIFTLQRINNTDKSFTIHNWSFAIDGELVSENEQTPFTDNTLPRGVSRTAVASAGNSWVLNSNADDNVSALQLVDRNGNRRLGDGGYRWFYANRLCPDGDGGCWLVRLDESNFATVLHLNSQGRLAHAGWSHAGFRAFDVPVANLKTMPGRNPGELCLIATIGGQIRAQIIRDNLVSVSDETADLPKSFQLYPAFPNPFNSMTTIRYALSTSGPVQLVLFDIQGRLVAELYKGSLPPGIHTSVWNAANLPGGTYLVKLSSPAQTRTVTAQLLK